VAQGRPRAGRTWHFAVAQHAAAAGGDDESGSSPATVGSFGRRDGRRRVRGVGPLATWARWARCQGRQPRGRLDPEWTSLLPGPPASLRACVSAALPLPPASSWVLRGDARGGTETRRRAGGPAGWCRICLAVNGSFSRLSDDSHHVRGRPVGGGGWSLILGRWRSAEGGAGCSRNSGAA